MGSCNKDERIICTKKRKGIFIVKKRERRDV